MHDGMLYVLIQGQGHRASEVLKIDFSKSTAQYLNLIRPDFCYLS